MKFGSLQRLLETGEDDTTKFVRVDPALIKSRYSHWNQHLFDNELPDMQFSTSRTKAYLGQTRSKVAVTPAMQRYSKSLRPFLSTQPALIPGSLQIDISTNWKYTQRQFDAILLHEMIHVWMVTHGQPYEDHGSNFMMKLRELSARTGFKIPTKNDPSELPHLIDRPGRRVIALIRTKKDGRKSAALFVPSLKPEELLDFWTKRVGSDDLKAYDTITSVAHELPVRLKSGSLDTRFAFIQPDQAAEIEAGRALNR